MRKVDQLLNETFCKQENCCDKMFGKLNKIYESLEILS